MHFHFYVYNNKQLDRACVFFFFFFFFLISNSILLKRKWAQPKYTEYTRVTLTYG
jgi:hypothetical protein